MKLRFKIQPKYLEAILNDEEGFEFRQFDSIELEEIGKKIAESQISRQDLDRYSIDG